MSLSNRHLSFDRLRTNGDFLRMVIASVLFLFGWKTLHFPSFRQDWKWLLALGLCEPCFYLTCEARAILRSRYLRFRRFWGMLFFAPTLLLPSTNLPSAFPAIPTLAVFYLGGCVTVFAYSFYNHALRHISATKASASINLIPVFALFFGWLLLDERLSQRQWYGIGLVVIGIALSSFEGTTPHEAASSI